MHRVNLYVFTTERSYLVMQHEAGNFRHPLLPREAASDSWDLRWPTSSDDLGKGGIDVCVYIRTEYKHALRLRVCGLEHSRYALLPPAIWPHFCI